MRPSLLCNLDGGPEMHDLERRFPDGSGTYSTVAANIPRSLLSPWIGRPLAHDKTNWCGPGKMLAIDTAGDFYPERAYPSAVQGSTTSRWIPRA